MLRDVAEIVLEIDTENRNWNQRIRYDTTLRARAESMMKSEEPLTRYNFVCRRQLTICV